TADDKGQFFIHLKAAEYYLKEHGKLPVNLKFLIEGEEEISSEHLGEFVAKNKEKLKCDVVMVSDTGMVDKGVPSITYSLRGLLYTELEVQGPNRDLHSGSFGGAVQNPANALCWMIAKLKDENGKVLIPGFYDDVRNISDMEKQMFAALPFNEKAYR